MLSEQTKLRLLHTYMYQVVGGVQRFTAISMLNESEKRTSVSVIAQFMVLGSQKKP